MTWKFHEVRKDGLAATHQVLRKAHSGTHSQPDPPGSSELVSGTGRTWPRGHFGQDHTQNSPLGRLYPNPQCQPGPATPRPGTDFPEVTPASGSLLCGQPASPSASALPPAGARSHSLSLKSINKIFKTRKDELRRMTVAACLPRQRTEAELHMRGTGYRHRVAHRLGPRGGDREVRCRAGAKPQLPGARRETQGENPGSGPHG